MQQKKTANPGRVFGCHFVVILGIFGHHVQIGTAGIQPNIHVSQFTLHELNKKVGKKVIENRQKEWKWSIRKTNLECANWTAESNPGMGIFKGNITRGLH
jgi:hypothetical protein